MSNNATLERPKAQAVRRRQNRTVIRRRQAPAPIAPKRTRPNNGLGTAAAVLVVSFAVTYFVSSLSGNIALEMARSDRIRMVERKLAVTSELSRLRRDVDKVAGMESIDRFAVANGMILSGEQPILTKPAAQSIVAMEDSRVAQLH